MKLNADFDQSVVTRPEDYKWVASPMPGVERMMLDRIGEEMASSTTIVRFAPNSEFAAHDYDGGEEIFVLEGTFHDEHGVYPQETWIRSPHLSKHHPFTKDDGATIFVKTGYLLSLR